MIIDTHVHYWQRTTPERPHAPDGIMWGDEMLAEDLFKLSDEAGVDRIVQLTASLMGFDNRYSLEMATRYPEKIVGVFGRFDPLAPRVAERLRDFMSHPRMMGVRLTLHQPPYDVWLRQGMLEPYLSAAQEQSVPLEIFAPFQAKEVGEMAQRYPGLQILVDHTAIRRMAGHPQRYAFWDDVLKVAELPNIWMKVSYFPEAAPDTERYPFPTSLEKFKQLYDHVGAERMIWGSNFPPVKRACSYKESVEFIKDACTFLSGADRKVIFATNFLRYMKVAGGKDW